MISKGKVKFFFFLLFLLQIKKKIFVNILDLMRARLCVCSAGRFSRELSPIPNCSE